MTTIRTVLIVVVQLAICLLGASIAPAAGQVSAAGLRAHPAELEASSRLYLPLAARGALQRRDVRTVILTDASTVSRLFELPLDSPDMSRWRSRLDALAAHPDVAGEVVQDLKVETDAQVAVAFAAWTANEDPTQINLKANAVATALRDWIWRQRATAWPNLRYIVIAGDDRVLPYFRLRVDPPAVGHDDWATEADYFDDGTVAADSTVGAALAADLTLNDDFYATAMPIPWTDGAVRLPIPELAVGRLVERPSDMSAVIDAYLARPQLTIHTSLLAGYDFMEDGVAAVEPRLAELLPPAARTRLIGSGWTIEQLRHALFEGRPDLFYFALHAAHFFAETPNNSKGALMAQDIAASPVDFTGMLVVGLACHAGLNTPGAKHPRAMDFPEAWLRHGATFVGSPGWAFGGDRKTPELRYEEQLMSSFVDLLLADGGTTVGDGLTRAKREYLAALTEQTAWHAKTIGGTVLYGLPMYGVQGRDGAKMGGHRAPLSVIDAVQ